MAISVTAIVLSEFLPVVCVGGGERGLAPRGAALTALLARLVQRQRGRGGERGCRRDGRRRRGGNRLVDAELRHGAREAGGLVRHAGGRGGGFFHERRVHLHHRVHLRDRLVD